MTTSPIQQQLLRKAIESPMFSKEILPKVPNSAFDDPIHKELVGIIKRYYKTNRDVLTEDALLTLTEDKLDRMKKNASEQDAYFREINRLYYVRDSGSDEVIDEQLENYIKVHMHKEILQEAALNLKDNDKLTQLNNRMRDVLLLDISGKQDSIINVIDDSVRVKQELQTIHNNTISTGFTAIDNLNDGGLAKGELGLVLASSGQGKTTVLTNLSSNYVKRGFNVAYIALEELQNRMLLRFEQTLFKQSRSNIFSGSVLNEEMFDRRRNAITKYRSNIGNLYFTRYSPKTVTPAKVEQILSDIMIREGVSLDVLIIDYPDLLRNPNATGNESEDGGRLLEEMRRIGQEYNVVTWTAGQLNRTANGAAVKTAEHIEGSYRKRNACELILVVNQTVEEFQAGFTRLYADKIRNTPEGPFNRMLGFKYDSSTKVLRDLANDGERGEHQAILAEAEENYDQVFKRKKQNNNAPAPDYASEINSAIDRSREQGGV